MLKCFFEEKKGGEGRKGRQALCSLITFPAHGIVPGSRALLLEDDTAIRFHLSQTSQRLKPLRERPASQPLLHFHSGVKLGLHLYSQQFRAWLRLSLTVKEIKLITWCHDSVHSPEDKWLISEVDKNVFVHLPLNDLLYFQAILQEKQHPLAQNSCVLSVELKGIKAQLCLKNMCILRFQLQLDKAPLYTWVARRTVTAAVDTQAEDRAIREVPLGNYSARVPGRWGPAPQCRLATKDLPSMSTAVIQGNPCRAGLCPPAHTSGPQPFLERCQRAHVNTQRLQEEGSLRVTVKQS